MDEILEKLGIYDLTVLLLTGMIILIFSLKILMIFNLNFEVNDTMQFLVISYFLGMIFQEIGYKINDKEMLNKVFEEQSQNYRISLSQKEVIHIKDTVAHNLNIKIYNLNNTEIYNYCKIKYLKFSKGSIEIDKQQSIGGMARSLFLYFVLVFLITGIKFSVCFDKRCICLSGISFICAIIFRHRYIRFYRMRYVHILRAFYYNSLNDSGVKRVKNKLPF